MAEQTFSQALREYKKLVNEKIITNNRNEILAPTVNDLLTRVGDMLDTLGRSSNRETIFADEERGYTDDELNALYSTAQILDRVIVVKANTEYEKISASTWIRKPIEVFNNPQDDYALVLSADGRKFEKKRAALSIVVRTDLREPSLTQLKALKLKTGQSAYYTETSDIFTKKYTYLGEDVYVEEVINKLKNNVLQPIT